MNVTLKDFHPLNTWMLDQQGPVWHGTNEPCYLIDKITNRRYWNESKDTVREKCILLTMGTPLVHAIAFPINAAYRLTKLITFTHFFDSRLKKKTYSFNRNLKEVGKDLLRIVAGPLAVIGLESAAIYGVFSPYNGRKLYASIERAEYGNRILAPCFQPNPTQHAFGGEPTKKNAY